MSIITDPKLEQQARGLLADCMKDSGRLVRNKRLLIPLAVITVTADEAIRAITAALSQQRVAPGWQPIKTAPRRGREMILLLTPSRFPQVAYSNTWWTAGFSVECKPTHWIPLPAAPSPEQEK